MLPLFFADKGNNSLFLRPVILLSDKLQLKRPNLLQNFGFPKQCRSCFPNPGSCSLPRTAYLLPDRRLVRPKQRLSKRGGGQHVLAGGVAATFVKATATGVACRG